MTAKILLNVSARRVTMGVFAQRRLSEVRGFANDDAARTAFAALLAAHPRTPVYLMTDVVEEDFRSETLPHVMGRARSEMVARKLAQLFRSAPYRAAWRQGRAQDKRRDDLYLFLALNSGDLLRPYLELIESRHAPLAGIYLLPVVSQALVERLKPEVPGVLLVSMQGGGLRQSFFLDGRLRISRLTPLEASDTRPFDQTLAEEIEKSRLFIYNTRLFSRDAPLQVWVLDPAGALLGACEGLPAEANFSCRALGLDAMAKAFGMAAADLPQDMDAMLLCLLGRHSPECSLALPTQTRGFAYHQWRHAVYAGAAAIAALAVMWGGYELYAHGDYRDRAGAAHRGNIVVVAQVHEPVGDATPDARGALIDVLLRRDAADERIGEGLLHLLEEAGLPRGVGVGEHEDLTRRESDARAERGPLAHVLEQHGLHARILERGDAVVCLDVGHIEHDDDLARVLGPPRCEAIEQDVRILME